MKAKSGKLISVLGILLILIGVGIFCYPKLTAFLYEQRVEEQKSDFVEHTSGEAPSVKVEELYQELLRRNQELYTERQKDLKDPFSYEQPDIDLSQYGLTDDIIGFVKIPKMEIELPIYLGANTSNMKKGAVHLTQTSYPIGGENSNSIIAAHRGYYKAPMFRNIHLLEPGDQVYIENFKETLTYEVIEIRIIEPDEIDQLLIQEGRDLVTLVSCHPLRGNSQRYVVFCERVEP